jgi:hypothetical protein
VDASRDVAASPRPRETASAILIASAALIA